MQLVFFFQGGVQLVKTALCLFSVTFDTTRAVPSLQSNEVKFGSLIMFSVYQCSSKGKRGSYLFGFGGLQTLQFGFKLQTNKIQKPIILDRIEIIISDVGIPSF